MMCQSWNNMICALVFGGIVGIVAPNVTATACPVTQFFPDGRDEVLTLLEDTEIGRETLKMLGQDTVAAMKSEKVVSEMREKKDEKWGPWKEKNWGAMTELKKGPNGKTIGGNIHIPNTYTNAQAAFYLVHEATHVRGGGEHEAIRNEATFVIQSKDKDVKSMERNGLILREDGREEPNEKAIKDFIEKHYPGWYETDPNIEYRNDKNGRRIIKYGKEDKLTGWLRREQ